MSPILMQFLFKMPSFVWLSDWLLSSLYIFIYAASITQSFRQNKISRKFLLGIE